MSNSTSTAICVAGLVAATLAAAAFVQMLAVWAHRFQLLDPPNRRSSHSRPVPRVGGLAIVAVTCLGAIAAVIAEPASLPALAAVLLPGLVVAGVSLADDVGEVPIRLRLAVHVAAAAVSTALLGPVAAIDLGSYGTLQLGPLAWPLTLFWIVGLTNAFNFMDGIDGIAGITAAVAGGALAAAGLACGGNGISIVAAALAASAAGFLHGNWQPAAIFMGDVGSTFLGFVLAALPLAAGPRRAVLVSVAAAAAWPFVFDTAFTLVRRMARRENLLQAHRSHLYQRMVASGVPHASVAALYGGLSLVGALLAVSAIYAAWARPTVIRIAAAFAVVATTGLVAGVRSLERRVAARPPAAGP